MRSNDRRKAILAARRSVARKRHALRAFSANSWSGSAASALLGARQLGPVPSLSGILF
ncbi:hypothetical protein [Streptomyces sp. NBC_01615]|uniref:hypothetical protein n=1 Tax=Streptomyces sp. NBC_01615 TaxID=2975898 RepID=UPI00386CBCA9